MKKRTFNFLCMLLFVLPMLLFFVAGCANYNKFVSEYLQNDCEKITASTDWGPAFSLKFEAEGVEVNSEEIKAETIKYDRTGSISSTHVYIEGYRRKLSGDAR